MGLNAPRVLYRWQLGLLRVNRPRSLIRAQ